MAGPKSTLSLIAGLRASGNGSAATTVPTRISTRSNSSNAIGPARSGSPACVMQATGGLAALLLGHDALQLAEAVGDALGDDVEGLALRLRHHHGGLTHVGDGALECLLEQLRLPAHSLLP